jgi:hypothetical protein
LKAVGALPENGIPQPVSSREALTYRKVKFLNRANISKEWKGSCTIEL